MPVTALTGHLSTVAVLTAPLASAHSARIAVGSRLLRRHSATDRVPSFLISAAARDPCLTAPLASAHSARIALVRRLLRRRSATKNVSPRSSSARRRAIRTRRSVPRSQCAAGYRQAGEVTAMFASWMPESGHLDAHLRLPRFHRGPRPARQPGGTALLRPLSVACPEPFGATWLGSDQTHSRG